MTKYKCGHEVGVTILDENILSMSAWLEWCKSVGFEGDKSMCWECWCSKDKKEVTKK